MADVRIAPASFLSVLHLPVQPCSLLPVAVLLYAMPRQRENDARMQWTWTSSIVNSELCLLVTLSTSDRNLRRVRLLRTLPARTGIIVVFDSGGRLRSGARLIQASHLSSFSFDQICLLFNRKCCTPNPRSVGSRCFQHAETWMLYSLYVLNVVVAIVMESKSTSAAAKTGRDRRAALTGSSAPR